MDGDERFMLLALAEARTAGREGEVPVGAVVTVDGEVRGRGRNAPIATGDPTAHAEILALRAAAREVGNYRLGGATLFCTVEPCLMCLGAAILARIDRVVWGASDPKIGAVDKFETMLSRGAVFNHRFETRRGVLEEESAELLRAFFRERREVGRKEPSSGKPDEVERGPER